MRRPRASLVSLHSGGPGQPSAGIKTGCLQWLDAAGTKAGGSPPDKGRQVRRPLLSRPEATAPGTEKPRWSAAGRAPTAVKLAQTAHLIAKGARASQKARPRWAPCGAPSPRHFAEGNWKTP